jgi:hypothetical protein
MDCLSSSFNTLITPQITVLNFTGSYMTPKKYGTYLLFRQGLLVLSIVVVAGELTRMRIYALC